MNVGEKKTKNKWEVRRRSISTFLEWLCARVRGVVCVCGVCVHPFFFEYAKPLPNVSCLIALRAAGPRAFDTIHYTVLKRGIIPV